MKASKKVIIVCAAIIAVMVPLAVLGHGWKGGNSQNVGRQARLALGSDAEPRPACKAPLWGEGTWDIEEIKERLDLTDEEAERLEELIGEAEDLKGQLKEKLEAIRDIIGPKIQEITDEMREECQDVAEKIKPLLEELKELHGELMEAVEVGDDEAVEGIKGEIEAITDEIRVIKEESDCPPAAFPKVRERVKR